MKVFILILNYLFIYLFIYLYVKNGMMNHILFVDLTV